MVQGSFDSAQDDKGTGSRLWVFGSRLSALGKETPGYRVEAMRLTQLARVDHLAGPPLLRTSDLQSDSASTLPLHHNKPSTRDYNETFTAMLTPGCWPF